MRFLIDANLPRSITRLLQDAGHRSEFARDIGLGAAKDEEIAARARATGAALLTRDLDFADIRRYPPAMYAGIIVVRLPDDSNAKDITQVVDRFLREPTFLAQLNGRLVIVAPDHVRFRPPLV